MSQWPETAAERSAFVAAIPRLSQPERLALASDLRLDNPLAMALFEAMVRASQSEDDEQRTATDEELGELAIALVGNPSLNVRATARIVRNCFDSEWIEERQRAPLLRAFADNPAMPLLTLVGELTEGTAFSNLLPSVRRTMPVGSNRGTYALAWPSAAQAPFFWPELEKLFDGLARRGDVSAERRAVEELRDWPEHYGFEPDTQTAFPIFAQVNRLPPRLYESNMLLENTATALLFVAVMQRIFGEAKFLRYWWAPSFWRLVEPYAGYTPPAWFWEPMHIVVR